jgi:ribonuclease P protein component
MGEKFLRAAEKKDAGNSPSATSASPRTREPHRVRRTLKRAEILSGRNNFQLVFKHGRKFQAKYLGCLILTDARLKLRAGSMAGIGFTSPRGLKRAVDRNRLKRLAREAYRLNKEILLPKLNGLSNPLALIFLYTSNVAGSPRFPTFAEVELDMKKLLNLLAETRIEGSE